MKQPKGDTVSVREALSGNLPRTALLSLLEKTPVWDGVKPIRLTPKWAPLPDVAKQATDESGIYALGLSSGISYEGGTSRVIYVGSAQNLRVRLCQHRDKPHNAIIDLIQDFASEPLLACYWLLPKLTPEWLKTIESEILWGFEYGFGTVPVANRSMPGSNLPCYSQLIEVRPCSDVGCPLTLEHLAQHVGNVLDMQHWHGVKYAFFVGASTIEERQRERVEQLQRIKIYEVSVWSVEKMLGLIRACSRLTPEAPRSSSATVQRFQAKSRDVPRPHTWGEVAIVQGRIIAGSWRPEKDYWIKVFHRNELLGEAKFSERGFRGNDKSDLPQRTRLRKEFYECHRHLRGASQEEVTAVMTAAPEQLFQLATVMAEDERPGLPKVVGTSILEESGGSTQASCVACCLLRPESTDLTTPIDTRMTLIPAGEFLMGASESDVRSGKVAMPQCRVSISQPFFLGRFPVTEKEYHDVLREDPILFKREKRVPIVNVSWMDALRFCNRLSKLSGREPYYHLDATDVTVQGCDGYRLPTEAEWEYACRAGTTTRWSCGDDESKLNSIAWFDANSDGITHPVGERRPNEWGLFDMHGNVWEWCWDGLDWHQSRPLIVNNPRMSPEGVYRVVRGGSYHNCALQCCAAVRAGVLPWSKFVHLGFRVARNLSRE